MVRPIVKDVMFLQQKAEAATKADRQVAEDLLDTLRAHAAECVGMAANMIGERKAIIAFTIGPFSVAMFNPQIISRSDPYEVEEGCLSLTGTRKTTRYKKILLEYHDMDFEKHRHEYTGLTAEIIEHECDHLEGIII